MNVEVEIGSMVSNYRVERLLGSGAMGTVYLAHDVHLERPVALKLLAAELARDERFRERFLRESRTAARLEHPAIVPIYAAGEAEGTLFLAMRYVEGSDLRDIIKQQGPLDPDRVVTIVGPRWRRRWTRRTRPGSSIGMSSRAIFWSTRRAAPICATSGWPSIRRRSTA